MRGLVGPEEVPLELPLPSPTLSGRRVAVSSVPRHLCPRMYSTQAMMQRCTLDVKALPVDVI